MTASTPVPPATAAGGPVARNTALDGVRGLSIALLMGYHFGISALHGAWVGLNLFFVFSGYVIGHMLLVERQKTGHVDALRFYLRRARRLLPALFLLLGTMAIWALLFAEPVVRRQMRGDLLASLGFVQNWRLIDQADQYFVEFGTPSFLRHVWTLSVEEQFYLVAPFLVLFVASRIRRRSTRFWVVMALAGASAWRAASIGLDGATNAAHAYYGTDTRVQAVLVGLALAFALGPERDGSRPALVPVRWLSGAAWVATACLFSAFFLVEPLAPWTFENGGLLLMALVTCVVVAAAADRRTSSFRRVFSNRVLAYLGVLTYSLYLWHWPIKLWLQMYVPSVDGWALVVVGSVLTLAAGAFSFHVVELPILQRGIRAFGGSARRGKAIVASSIVALVVLAFAVGRVPSLDEEIAAGDAPALVTGTAAYEPLDRTVPIAVWGDSLPHFLVERLPEKVYRDLDLTNLAVPGCSLVPLDVRWSETVRRSVETDCAEGRESLTQDIESSGARTVLAMTGSTLSVEHYTEDGAVSDIDDQGFRDRVRTELDRLLADIRAAGAEPVLTTVPCRDRDISVLDFMDPTLVPHLEANPRIADRIADPVEVNEVLTAWAQDNGIAVLDLYDALGCNVAFSASINGIKVFEDYFHFSVQASAMVWTWLAPAVREQALTRLETPDSTD